MVLNFLEDVVREVAFGIGELVGYLKSRVLNDTSKNRIIILSGDLHEYSLPFFKVYR